MQLLIYSAVPYLKMPKSVPSAGKKMGNFKAFATSSNYGWNSLSSLEAARNFHGWKVAPQSSLNCPVLNWDSKPLQILNCHIIFSKINKTLSRNKKDFAKLCSTTRANGLAFTRRISFFPPRMKYFSFFSLLHLHEAQGRHKRGNQSLKTWAKSSHSVAVNILLIVKEKFLNNLWLVTFNQKYQVLKRINSIHSQVKQIPSYSNSTFHTILEAIFKESI